MKKQEQRPSNRRISIVEGPCPPRKGQIRQAGFTLLEILIVLSIITTVFFTVAPRLASPTNQMKNTIRKLSTMTRDLHNAARLKNMTFRLVIKMDGQKGSSYWVESASGRVGVMSQEKEEEIRRMSDRDREALNLPSFSEDTSILKERQILPRNVKFLEVEYADREQGVTEGTTYIHFFPQGMAQEAAIHVGDGEKIHWTLAIRPLTGHTDMIPANRRLKELQQ